MKYYDEVMELYGGRCVECNTNKDVHIHHKLPNTKINRKRFPIFVSSPMNLIPLCGGFQDNCHEKFKHKYKITEREAEVFERYLNELITKEE